MALRPLGCAAVVTDELEVEPPYGVTGTAHAAGQQLLEMSDVVRTDAVSQLVEGDARHQKGS